MKTIVSMNREGRLTVPSTARAALQVQGPAQFELEVTDNALILRPVVVIPRDDAWAYAPAHVRRVERARQEGRARGRQLTKEELQHLPVEED